MDTSVMQWIVQQAGMAGIAALSLVMLNRVWEERARGESKRAEEINAMRQQMLDALNRNTEAITRLIERLDKKS